MPNLLSYFGVCFFSSESIRLDLNIAKYLLQSLYTSPAIYLTSILNSDRNLEDTSLYSHYG